MESSSISIHTYLKLINKEIFKMVQEQMQEYNLTKSQLDILRLLANKNTPLCQKQIQDALHVTNPTVTGLLNRLESKGLIKRISDPLDHRMKTIEMTKLAKEFDQKIHACFDNLDQTLTKGLSSHQVEVLSQALPIILSNLERGDLCDTDITCTSKGI